MIRTFRLSSGSVVHEDGARALDTAETAVWIDLNTPSEEEERRVEAAVGAGIPTPAEMAEIEVSSRIYTEHGAAVMTAPLLLKSAAPYPQTTEVTFVLTEDHLVSIRYAEPSALASFATALHRTPEICATPASAFSGLLDAIADRLADVLEETTRDLDALSRTTFTEQAGPGQLHDRMQRLGRAGEVISKARESLVGLARIATFAKTLPQIRGEKAAADRLKTVAGDIDVLLEHASSLAGKITFLLDALLGMINIEQNAIIKIFSVVAVVFLPPTLIASIYGMNFEHMPELGWPFGYPLALGAMAVSMILPYLFFKRKGWI